MTASKSGSKDVSAAYNPARRIRHETLKDQVRLKNPRILFIGDSLTDQWRDAGFDAWKQHFEPLGAAEIGIGGDRAEDLVWRVRNGAVEDINPEIVLICIGANDVLVTGAAETAAMVDILISELQKNLEKAEIILFSLLPYGRLSDSPERRNMHNINNNLKFLAVKRGIKYFDFSELFLDDNGRFPTEYSVDGVHLTRKAYFKWAEMIRDELGILQGSPHSIPIREDKTSDENRDHNDGTDISKSSPSNHTNQQDDEPNVLRTMVEGRTFYLEPGESDLLWVFISPKAMQDGRFAFFNAGRELSGWKLFLRTPYEDFYQAMFDEIFSYIESLRKTTPIRRVIYVGFSAGAYAALVLGLRGRGTHRIISFAPQFRLDHPLTIAFRTLTPWADNNSKYDPRFFDINDDVRNAAVPVDMFFGVREVSDGIMVKESLEFTNPLVKSHYVLWNHDVGAEISRAGAMSGIMKAAETGEPIPLPERILATTEEAGVAVKMYEIAKALDFDHELVELPSNDDHVGDNPAWWDLKARVRFKNGDVYGAISDVMRAITLRPNSEGSHVCLGHFFREIKHFDLTATAYECAIRLNDQAWAGLVGLSRVQAHQERWKEAKNTLEIARKRGAPNELLEEVFLSEKRA